MNKNLVIEIDFNKKDADWLKTLREKTEEPIQKEQAVPPRPGLVFDRQRHRWVRPVKEGPKEPKSSNMNKLRISIPDDIKVDEEVKNVVKDFEESLEKMQNDDDFVPSYSGRGLLESYFGESVNKFIPLLIDYYTKALDVCVKNEKHTVRFQYFAAWAQSLVSILTSDECKKYSKEIRALIETCLRKKFVVKDIEPNFYSLNELYTSGPVILRRYFGLFCKYASSLSELEAVLKVEVSDELLEKFRKKLYSWLEHPDKISPAVHARLENLMSFLAVYCKPSQLETIKELEHKEYMTLSSYADPEVSSLLERKIKERQDRINKVGLNNIKHFAETGELKLPIGNEFRSMLEAVPDMSVKDPGKETKKLVREIMSELGLAKVHSKLVLDWEKSANSTGGNVLSTYIAKLYDEKVKYHKLRDELSVSSEVREAEDRFGEDKLLEYTKKHYELTQQMLKYSFPHKNTITLYRGTSVEEGKGKKFKSDITEGRVKLGDSVEVDANSVSSWTLDKKVARKFAKSRATQGVVLKAEVPLSSVFGYLASYCYNGNEREFLVIKRPENTYYLEDTWVHYGDDND